MRFTKLLTMACALVTVVTLAGCGAESDSGQPKPEHNSPEHNSPEHNSADITFVQRMIPHHRQAVAMAKLADQRAGSQAVKQLAARIEAEQQPEIDQMTMMLKGWNAPASQGSGDMPGHSMPGHSMSGQDTAGTGMGPAEMPGMMSDQQMAGLATVSGALFDQQFLTMMIGHHQGAIDMAATELRDGLGSDAKALAQRITGAQRAEIDQMRGMLTAS